VDEKEADMPPNEFRTQIERFTQNGGDESVRMVMEQLADAIQRRESYLSGASPAVRMLRAKCTKTNTAEERANALWGALAFIRPSDQAYGRITTDRIWQYLVSQAHAAGYLAQAELDAYNGEKVYRPSLPASSSTYPTRRSGGLLSRFGRGILKVIFRIDVDLS
jgi:hypothetical protein